MLEQRDVELELLAIDDGSEDDSAEILRRLDDPRVRHLDVHGAGVIAAIEEGRRKARGAWIARMDADDRCSPERLRAQLDAMLVSPRLGAIGTRVDLFPAEAIADGLRAYVEWQNGLLTPADHARDIFVESPLCNPSVLLRREALDAVGGWRDEGWPEDYDLFFRLWAAGWELAKLPEVLVSWRHTAGRATFTHPRYAMDRFRALRAAFLAPELLRRGRPVAIWGAGRTGRRLARALEEHGVSAACFVDIDPVKIGRVARGAPIIAPDALVVGEHTIVVAVGARGARDLVRARLRAAGHRDGEDFLCAS